MAQKFCPNCGSPRKEGARFCSSCGSQFDTEAPRPLEPVAAQPAEAQHSDVRQPLWQTVIGDALPAFKPVTESFLPQGTVPSAGHQSLRGASRFLLFTAASDIVCALATSSPAAMGTVGVRAISAGVCAFSGMAAGSKRGVFSIIMGVSSLILALTQGVSMFQLIKNTIHDPQMLGMAASQALSLFKGSSLSTVADTILDNPAALTGAWMNIVAQGASLFAALEAFRQARK